MGKNLKVLAAALLALPVFAFDAMDFDEDFLLATGSRDVLDGCVLRLTADNGDTSDSVGNNTAYWTNRFNRTTPSYVIHNDGLAFEVKDANYILVKNGASLPGFTNNFSVCFWVRQDALNVGAYDAYMLRSDVSELDGLLIQNRGANNELRFYSLVNGKGYYPPNVPSITKDDMWHLIVVVYSYPNQLIYVDSVPSSAVDLPERLQRSDFDISVGSAYGNQHVTASFDDVRIYNRVLSSNEVATIYNHFK